MLCLQISTHSVTSFLPLFALASSELSLQKMHLRWLQSSKGQYFIHMWAITDRLGSLLRNHWKQILLTLKSILLGHAVWEKNLLFAAGTVDESTSQTCTFFMHLVYSGWRDKRCHPRSERSSWAMVRSRVGKIPPADRLSWNSRKDFLGKSFPPAEFLGCWSCCAD